MPPNATSMLQSMDQGEISTFKAYYLPIILKQMIKAIDTNSSQNVRDY